jgi:membrane glycosyltransferase
MVRKYSGPTFVGVLMAISAYLVSLPLLLWMTPVILGLLLSVPVAMVSSRLLPAGRGASLFSTPEQNVPPAVLARANALALAAPEYGVSPLHALRTDSDLRRAHQQSLHEAPRSRGQIDSDLVIARAKIADAEHFEEAMSFLTSRETFAVLNSRSALQQLDNLPDRPLV